MGDLMTLTMEERTDLLETVRILRHIRKHDELANRVAAIANRLPEVETKAEPQLERELMARMIRRSLVRAADAEAEALIRWPADTPYKGAEEEAQAAAYATEVLTLRTIAHELAELLP
jgi:hypothetical protein